MRKVLILLTSSYPYGAGETFVANEMPFLAGAFDRILVVSNDTWSAQTVDVPISVTCVRRSYALDPAEKVASLRRLLSPEVRQELGWVRRRYGLPVTRNVLATALVAWQKAHKFAELIRRLAEEFPQGQVHAYSYWANDMAVAAALARRNGWVHRAYCRAHRWDIYMHLTGYLPFREFVALNLDHVLFVSEDGLRYHETLMGRSYPSLGVARLGTHPTSPRPIARSRPFTVVSCSNLIPVKRVELIAEALHGVASPVRWIHVGDGPSRALVEAACRDLPDRVCVELRGAMPNPAVLALLTALRPSLLINVSLSEGLPVSIMEAMSLGIPVMATDVGGVREIVANGSNGVLLPPEPTPAEVASALDAFAALPEDAYASYSQQAWHTWDTRFRAEQNYRSFIELIGE